MYEQSLYRLELSFYIITRVRYSISLYNITYDCSYTDKVYMYMFICMYMFYVYVYVYVCMYVYICVFMYVFKWGEVSIGT